MNHHLESPPRALRGLAARIYFTMVLIIGVLGSFGAAPVAAEDRPMLRLGSSGDAVLVLEDRLVELGYGLAGVDSVFGSDTRSAVLVLQEAAGVGVDGIVGPVTWGVLDSGLRAPEPAPDPEPEPRPPDGDSTLLKEGSSGPEVLALEQRLQALGYWLPGADDVFDINTHHAVVALQKAAGIGRDGVVGPITRDALESGARPSAVGNGDLLEVDLTRQLLLVVRDGAVVEIHDAATGRAGWRTPTGTYSITREIDGFRYAPLGTLYRPKYFNRGIAFHGYPSVPSQPASHGCVRVTYPAMDHLWETGVAEIDTVVSVHY